MEGLYVAGYYAGAVVAFRRDPHSGRLTQLHGAAGCISEGGAEGCRKGRALASVFALTVSPDGKNAYAGTYHSDAVVVMRRNPETGALTQLSGKAGCVSESGNRGACQRGNALKDAIGIVVSPDGRSAYVAGFESDAVAIFDRDPATGALTQKPGTTGCISEDGNGACQKGDALNSPERLTISPDGKNVYAEGQFSASVAIFDRDPLTEALTQKPGGAGCISEAVSESPACRPGKALGEPTEIVASPDGANVYVASSGQFAIAIFDRDPLTGALTQKAGVDACISELRTNGACHVGQGLFGATGLAITPDGRNLYVAGADGNAVAAFDRRSAG